MAKEKRTRQCLVTGESLPAYKQVRFVCAPDGFIVPDVAAKLPGRGCWVRADRDVLKEAVKRKVFLRFGQKVLKAEDKNKSVKVAEDLLDQIEELLAYQTILYKKFGFQSLNISEIATHAKS